MKSHMRALIYSAFIFGIAASPTTVFAGMHGYAKGDFKNDPQMKEKWEKKKAEMYEKLGLSEEQKTQLEAFKTSHREQKMKLRESIREKRQALKEELQKPDFDEKKVKKIHGELKSLNAKKDDAHLDGILQVRKVLTPEQFSKFSEFKKEHKGKWREGAHKGSLKGSMKENDSQK